MLLMSFNSLIWLSICLALFIPLFVPNLVPSTAFSPNLVLSSVESDKIHQPQAYNASRTHDAMFDFSKEINDNMKKLTNSVLAKVKPLFLYVTSDDLDLHTLNTQTALNLLRTSPPFSTNSIFKSLQVAPILSLDQYFLDLLFSVTLPSTLRSFLATIDRRFLNRFQLLERPVAAFVMEVSSKTSEKSEKKSSQILDTFASFWNSASSLPQLLHSTFCTYNPNSTQGYCMLMEGHNKIHLSTLSGLSKRDGIEDHAALDVFNSQVLRQVQNKLESVAHKVSSSAEYLADDPQAYLDDLDERVDNRIKEVERKVLRKTQKLTAIPGKIDVAVDNQVRKLAESRLVIHEDDDVEDILPWYHLERNDGDEGNDITIYETRDRPLHFSKREQADITIPLSLLLVGKNTPRHKLFQNVVKQSTDLSLKKRDCVPVTWYNVFHHSVFGNYEFCE